MSPMQVDEDRVEAESADAATSQKGIVGFFLASFYDSTGLRTVDDNVGWMQRLQRSSTSRTMMKNRRKGMLRRGVKL